MLRLNWKLNCQLLGIRTAQALAAQAGMGYTYSTNDGQAPNAGQTSGDTVLHQFDKIGKYLLIVFQIIFL